MDFPGIGFRGVEPNRRRAGSVTHAEMRPPEKGRSACAYRCCSVGSVAVCGMAHLVSWSCEPQEQAMSTPEQATGAGAHTVITGAGNTTTLNAVELLKSDHRQVEEWFDQFDATEDALRRQELAADICRALEVHMRLEEEVFYPAFLEATGNESLHHQSVVEHQGARELLGRIRLSAGPSADDYLDARVKVLAELIHHHVSEEENPGGMFDEAERSGIDLDSLGERIEHRKLELMDDSDTDRGYDEAVGRPDDGEEIGPEFEDDADSPQS
jgi:hemerythrin superfamily protein